MEQIGYSLIDASGNELRFWGDAAGQMQGVPDVVRLPSGDDVHCPSVGTDYEGARLVERWLQFGSATSIVFDGVKVLVTRVSPPPIVPDSISDRQFFQQLAVQGIITQEEALAANAAVIPQPLLDIIDAMPVEQQFAAKMIVSGATVFERQHPMTIAIGAAYGWTAKQIDDFFIAAAAL